MLCDACNAVYTNDCYSKIVESLKDIFCVKNQEKLQMMRKCFTFAGDFTLLSTT